MFTLESFQKQYETDTKDLTIRGRSFSFFVARSLESFVDSQDIFNDFPLWIKIWEASMVLADYLAGLKVEPEKRFLEIGCGLGLVGIVASAFGHHVTVTEYNQDALNFARANALLNKASNMEIKEMNWNNPQLQGSFDTIIGSEIIYKESDFPSILNLFRTYLKDGGEIILAEGIRKTSMEFMRQMGDSFNIKAQKRIFRSQDREIMIMLCRMRMKS